MATQGILSIVDNNRQTIIKVITGADGHDYKLETLKEKLEKTLNIALIKKNTGVTLATGRLIYDVAQEIVKNKISLYVVFRHVVDDSTLDYFPFKKGIPPLYLDMEKFLDPTFNPRWENGTADYVVVL